MSTLSTVEHPNRTIRAPRALVGLLALAAGAAVANLYYSQPLLKLMAASFGVSAGAISMVATATQAGYAIGLLLLVPLGDAVERRSLIVLTSAAVVIFLLAAGLAPTLSILIASSFLLGAATIVPQLVVPYAASIAGPEERGQVIGTVMSGLLVGILLSRTISGFMGAHAGWRVIYYVAAAGMIGLAVLLRFALPTQKPEHAVRYTELLRSLGDLIAREPVLRRHSLVGGFSFAAFGVFWTTLAFQLAALPGHYGSQTVGLFGIVGAAGALVAPLAGRLADRHDARVVNGIALFLVVLAFAALGLFGSSLAGIAAGVILLDIGVQVSHISNQTRIYALDPAHRNRLNAVYMVAYFIGGAAGSALGALAWQKGQWPAVCLAGGGFAVAAVATLFFFAPQNTIQPPVNQRS